MGRAAVTSGTSAPAKYRKHWIVAGYRIPQPGTYENDCKLDHVDVATMNATQLWAEGVRVRHALADLVSSCAGPLIRVYPGLESVQRWLGDRVAMIDAEVERRRDGRL